MFNSYVPQRINLHFPIVFSIKSHETTIFPWFFYDFPWFPMVFPCLNQAAAGFDPGRENARTPPPGPAPLRGAQMWWNPCHEDITEPWYKWYQNYTYIYIYIEIHMYIRMCIYIYMLFDITCVYIYMYIYSMLNYGVHGINGVKMYNIPFWYSLDHLYTIYSTHWWWFGEWFSGSRKCCPSARFGVAPKIRSSNSVLKSQENLKKIKTKVWTYHINI